MDALIAELKQKVVEALNLEELSAEEINENTPLFGADGLGLDSIDALELIVLLDKEYGIRLYYFDLRKRKRCCCFYGT